MFTDGYFWLSNTWQTMSSKDFEFIWLNYAIHIKCLRAELISFEMQEYVIELISIHWSTAGC